MHRLRFNRKVLPALLALLAMAATARDLPPIAEKPDNYRVTISRDIDPRFNWVITIDDDNNIKATGQETDPNDQRLLTGSVWKTDGAIGMDEDAREMSRPVSIIESATVKYPYSLLSDFPGMPASLMQNDSLPDELRKQIAEKMADETARMMHELYRQQTDQPCGDMTCSVYRRVIDPAELNVPTYADYFVDKRNGYVKQVVIVEQAGTFDGQAYPGVVETATYEYNVSGE